VIGVPAVELERKRRALRARSRVSGAGVGLRAPSKSAAGVEVIAVAGVELSNSRRGGDRGRQRRAL
jgi:hypothetical protein